MCARIALATMMAMMRRSNDEDIRRLQYPKGHQLMLFVRWLLRWQSMHLSHDDQTHTHESNYHR